MNKKSFFIVSFVLLFLLSLELVLHLIQPYLSKDLKHYKEMQTLLDTHQKVQGEKILFIGNSLTREGVQEKLYLDNNISVTRIFPDDTTINEWSWIFRNMVYDKIKITELNIVFVGPQLKDKKLEEQNLVSISHLTNTVDIPDVIKFENLDLSDSVTFILAHASAIFSSRERIQRRVLDVLPYYRQQSRLINKSLKVAHPLPNSQHKKNTYKHLNMLIELAQEKNIHITFIAAPLPKFYDLDKKLLDIIDATSTVSFLDARQGLDIDMNDFSDGYHLNKKGAKKFTQFMIENRN